LQNQGIIMKTIFDIDKRIDKIQKSTSPLTWKWEATEWLIGSMCTLIWTGDMFCVGSTSDELADDNGGNFTTIAESMGIPEKLREHFPGRFIGLRGTFVGPDIQRNPYKLNARAFYCFDIYDSHLKRYLTRSERNEIVALLGICSEPLVYSEQPPPDFAYTKSIVDGPSQLLASQKRFGININCVSHPRAFSFLSRTCVLELRELRKLQTISAEAEAQ
jgi:hypothetical protein